MGQFETETDMPRTQEAERQQEEQDARERNIALGNPLLNKQDFNMKRRWNDDVVFKNQARGTEDKGKKEFVNVSFLSSTYLCSFFMSIFFFLFFTLAVLFCMKHAPKETIC